MHHIVELDCSPFKITILSIGFRNVEIKTFVISKIKDDNQAISQIV